MPNKRKRDTNHDDTFVGSPTKKQKKSLSIALNNIQLTPSQQTNQNPSNSPLIIPFPTHNQHENDDDEMYGDDEQNEEDIDVNLEYDNHNNNDENKESDIDDPNHNNKTKRKKKRKKLKRRKYIASQQQQPAVTPEQQKKFNFGNHLTISQSECTSTDDPSNTTSNDSPIIPNVKRRRFRSKTVLVNSTTSPANNNSITMNTSKLLLTSPPQRRSQSAFIGSSSSNYNQPLTERINYLNSPSRIKILKPNHGNEKVIKLFSPKPSPFTTPSPVKTQLNRRRKELRRRKRRLRSGLLWQELKKIDVLVPPPADDLCDRHLLVIHIDSNEYKMDNDDGGTNDCGIVSSGDSDIHGLDSDSPNNIVNLEKELLPNTKLSEGSMNMVSSMEEYGYRIIKIAKFALSIKSAYFHNLLSKQSSFVESGEELVPIKIHRYYAFAFEILMRLLHIDPSEIDQYLMRLQNHRTLLQLLILIDQFQIKHIDQAIIKRLKFLASRGRPKHVTFKKQTNIPNRNTNKPKLQIKSNSAPTKDRNSNIIISDGNKENIEHKARRSLYINRKNIDNNGNNVGSRETDDESEEKGNNYNKNLNRNVKHHYGQDIQHIIPGFDASFDNGGMTLLEVSDLMIIGDEYQCLLKCKEIGKYSLRKRYKKLTFNKYGIVDLDFLKLPSIAINIILKENDFCTFNENDVFLACTQWAAYPLYADTHEEHQINNNRDQNNPNQRVMTMNPHDNKNKEVVHKRFNEIWEHIRYQYIDRWFLDTIITNYDPIKHNNKLLLKLLKTSSKAALCNNNHGQSNPRWKEINDYFQFEKPPRSIPYSYHSKQENNLNRNVQNGTNWEDYSIGHLSDLELRRFHEEYDRFDVVFNRSELINLEIGQRITSQIMVWRGMLFALDLVRKKQQNERRDSCGIFLYCQGLECLSTIWIKYSLKTIGHDHALQCSDYKMMQLNFQKGNGSRDFFGCSWNQFLNNFFDMNHQLRFKLTFIGAK